MCNVCSFILSTDICLTCLKVDFQINEVSAISSLNLQPCHAIARWQIHSKPNMSLWFQCSVLQLTAGSDILKGYTFQRNKHLVWTEHGLEAGCAVAGQSRIFFLPPSHFFPTPNFIFTSFPLTPWTPRVKRNPAHFFLPISSGTLQLIEKKKYFVALRNCFANWLLEVLGQGWAAPHLACVHQGWCKEELLCSVGG